MSLKDGLMANALLTAGFVGVGLLFGLTGLYKILVDVGKFLYWLLIVSITISPAWWLATLIYRFTIGFNLNKKVLKELDIPSDLKYYFDFKVKKGKFYTEIRQRMIKQHADRIRRFYMGVGIFTSLLICTLLYLVPWLINNTFDMQAFIMFAGIRLTLSGVLVYVYQRWYNTFYNPVSYLQHWLQENYRNKVNNYLKPTQEIYNMREQVTEIGQDLEVSVPFPYVELLSNYIDKNKMKLFTEPESIEKQVKQKYLEAQADLKQLKRARNVIQRIITTCQHLEAPQNRDSAATNSRSHSAIPEKINEIKLRYLPEKEWSAFFRKMEELRT